MGILKFCAIGKTDGACFIKKSAREKTTSGFAHVLHGRPVDSELRKNFSGPKRIDADRTFALVSELYEYYTKEGRRCF